MPLPESEHHEHHRHPILDRSWARKPTSSASPPLGFPKRTASIISIIASFFWVPVVGETSILGIAFLIAGHLETGGDNAGDARCRFRENEMLLAFGATSSLKAAGDDADDARMFCPFKPAAKM